MYILWFYSVKYHIFVEFIKKCGYFILELKISLLRIIKMNNVQSDFLNDIKNEKVSVTVFLINGVKLQGIITQHDENSLLLRRDGHTQLVYKNAISTIMPSVAIDIAEE